MLESGLVRTKNNIHVALKNVLDLGVAGLVFGAVGYTIMFGVDLTWWRNPDALTPRNLSIFAYQIVFCGTAVTIISGAVAERMRLDGYLVVATITALAIYPIIGSWVWGDTLGNASGWLQERGFVDFAGATVVHATGGWVALAAILVIGPRVGRFTGNGEGFAGQNLALSALGSVILWVGWLGFNGGGHLAFSPDIPLIFVNTVIAGTGGTIAALLLSYARSSVLKVEHLVHGLIGSLVAVTAACHVINPDGAFVLGASGALIAIAGYELLLHWHLDDVVGAVPAHAFAGSWGTLGVALFGDLELLGTGLSRTDQLAIQALGAICCAAWAFGVGFVLLKLANAFLPLRVDAEAEHVGLNVAEHGASSALLDLLGDMEQQRTLGDFSTPVTVEPNTEVGQIANQYNQVLHKVNEEAAHALQMSELANTARTNAEGAQRDLAERVDELAQFNKVAVGREHRMIELKAEINVLLQEQQQADRYDLDFPDEQ